MSKSEVKQKQKNASSLCRRMVIGCLLFMSSYASLYYFLFHIARNENVAFASSPDYDGNDDVPDNVKGMQNFKGARWLRGEEALEAIRKMNAKKDQPVHPDLANVDMADAIARAMGQMGDEDGTKSQKQTAEL